MTSVVVEYPVGPGSVTVTSEATVIVDVVI
jgi:hypothetical protein